MPDPFAIAPLIRRRHLLFAAPALLLAGRGAAAAAAPSGDELPRAKRAVPVADAGELGAALAEARPGDHLLLGEGTYPGDLELAARGEPNAPIVVRPRDGATAKMTGRLLVSGAHTVLLGLRLEGAEVELAADGARMSRCRQADTQRIAVLVSFGRGVVVDRNELTGMRGRGVSVRPTKQHPENLQGTRIYRNVFTDFRAGRAKENVHEAIQLGQGKGHSRVSLNALVEWNLFEDVSIDTEVISIKSSDNMVRFNTIQDCDGFLSNRHGQRNRIVANWIERARGISVQDRDNQVLGNVLVDTKSGIRIMGGNVTPDEWPGRGTHPAAANTLVAANTADNGVIVGYMFRDKEIPATGTRLAGQAGRVDRRVEEGTTTASSAPAGIPKAARLTRAEVGPEAA